MNNSRYFSYMRSDCKVIIFDTTTYNISPCRATASRSFRTGPDPPVHMESLDRIVRIEA